MCALFFQFDPRVDAALKQEFMDELLVMRSDKNGFLSFRQFLMALTSWKLKNRVCSKLRHKNVVSLIGACVEPPNLCMVMELCEGSLHQALHGSSRFFSVQHLTRIAVRETSFWVMTWTLPAYRCSHLFHCSDYLFQQDVASGMRFLHSFSPAVIHRYRRSTSFVIRIWTLC